MRRIPLSVSRLRSRTPARPEAEPSLESSQ